MPRIATHDDSAENLTPIQAKALGALLAGATITAAAAEAGVDRATVRTGG